MKRSILSFALILCLLLPSCDWSRPDPGASETQGQPSDSANVPSQDKEDENKNDAGQSGVIATSDEERFGVTSYDEMSAPAYDEYCSFYSDTHYYYVYYLGRVDHVPLQDNATVYQYSGNKYTKEFTTKKTNVTTVSEMVTAAQSTSVTQDMNISGEAEFPIKAVEIEIGVSYTNSRTKETTATQSYEKASQYSDESSETTTFTFDDTCKEGYYRYVLFGDIDVFGVLVKEIGTEKYDTYIYNVIAAQYFGLDYSETSEFNSSNTEKLQFTLSQQEVDSLPSPKDYIGDKLDELPEEPKKEITDKYEYVSKSSAIKIDASDEKIHDTLDLGGLSAYLNENYVLHFKVIITMKEENSGYQEIYLCDDSREHVAGVKDHEHGGKGDPNDTYMDATFYWDVSGENCTQTMYLRYGAHGEGSDDWYRKQAKVYVTVSEK